MNILPAPDRLGLPGQFRSWRPYQEEAALAIIDSDRVPLIQVQPTGSGKSLTYAAAALLGFDRAVFLTSTKSLQRQLLTEFEPIGLVEVKGRNAYECLKHGGNCENQACQFGYNCKLADGGCYYFDAIRTAKRSRFVSTNYHFYTLINRFSENPLGEFDLVVADEGHGVPEVLTSCLKETLRRDEFPDMPESTDVETWRGWIRLQLEQISNLLDDEKRRGSAKFGDMRLLKKIYSRKRKLENLQGIDSGWLVYKVKNGYEFAPIDISSHAQRLLFSNGAQVLITSATVREKTAELLGFDTRPEGYRFLEYPSTFPVERRLVTYIPTARVDHRMDEFSRRAWLQKIVNIIRPRLDRKGIIHSVSYKRGEEIAEFLEDRFGSELTVISHNSKNINDKVHEFRACHDAAVIISPSLTTGYDFPGGQCEYQIISKLAFPDGRDPLHRERMKLDRDYGAYLTAQQLVQASGRGMRSATDRCETFIIDDHWTWFGKKFSEFIPAWFRSALRKSRGIPGAPARAC